MAFTISNARSGAVGDMHLYAADWTGTIGDADGTITLKGGRVYLCHVYDQSTDYDKPTPCQVSVSSGTITVTVGNRNTVTQGRLFIVYL